MSGAPDFTRAGYRALLQALLDRGYKVRDYDTVEPDAAHLILRHDIDLWPAAAVEMGRIEAEMGLSAWYFALTDSPLYALDDPETKIALRALLAQGHRVGLHFDASTILTGRADLNAAAESAYAKLEAVCGQPVTMGSFHRPVSDLLGDPDPLGGRAHSYQPRFFADIGYCSDSGGRWKHGHPLESAAVGLGRALQLLTHPIWWVHDDAGDREAALDRLVAVRGPWARAGIASVVSGYDPRDGRIRE